MKHDVIQFYFHVIYFFIEKISICPHSNTKIFLTYHLKLNNLVANNRKNNFHDLTNFYYHTTFVSCKLTPSPTLHELGSQKPLTRTSTTLPTINCRPLALISTTVNEAMETSPPLSPPQNDDEHIFCSRYPAVQVPDNVTLPEFVLGGSEVFAEKVAFVEAVTGKEYTHGEVVRDTKRFATALRSLGLRKGNVVIVVLPNVAEYAIVALGIMSAGGVFSGTNPTALPSEIAKQVKDADAKLIVTNGPNYEKVNSITFFSFYCTVFTYRSIEVSLPFPLFIFERTLYN